MNPQSLPLPAPIEQELSNLEKRHKAHQKMLYDHYEAKHERRKRHRERRTKPSVIPITLV